MSDEKVIELSRKFVCARLLTYENAQEAEFLKALFRTRSGELENTVFALLAPDGRTQLVPPGRSPDMSLGRSAGVQGLRDAMADAIKRHPGNDAAQTPGPVPYHQTVRLGLATAAADIRPLVVVCTADAATRTALDPELATLVWSEDLRGRFSVAHTTDRAELAAITGVPDGDCVVLIAPDDYGQKGAVVAATTELTPDAVRTMLTDGLAKYRPSDKQWIRLMREGQRQGLEWKTAIPVTDPGAVEAERRRRDRGR